MTTNVQELSPYFQKNLSNHLIDNKRSYYPCSNRYTNAELMYIIVKFSTFLFNKQYKYGPFLQKQNKLLLFIIHSHHPIQ